MVAKVCDGAVTEITEISFVGEDHEFGVAPDGLLHIEGSFTRALIPVSAPLLPSVRPCPPAGGVA